MTLRYISAAQARLLRLAVEVDIPRRMSGWLDQLDTGQLTEEMRDVFEAFGYLEQETRRQRKPKIGYVRAAEPTTEEEIERAVEDATTMPPAVDQSVDDEQRYKRLFAEREV